MDDRTNSAVNIKFINISLHLSWILYPGIIKMNSVIKNRIRWTAEDPDGYQNYYRLHDCKQITHHIEHLVYVHIVFTSR